MGRKSKFFMTIILGGVVFLLPLVFLTMVLGKAYQLMMVIAKPVDAWIPLDSIGNIALVNVVAVFLPGAPDPWSGSAVFVTPDRVSPIDTEVKAALRTFKKLGLGSTVAIGQVRMETS